MIPHRREESETELIAQWRVGELVFEANTSSHSSPLESCNFKYDKNVHLSNKQHLDPLRFSQMGLFSEQNTSGT